MICPTRNVPQVKYNLLVLNWVKPLSLSLKIAEKMAFGRQMRTRIFYEFSLLGSEGLINNVRSS